MVRRICEGMMRRLRVTLDICATDDVRQEQMVEFIIDLGGQIAPPKMRGKTLHVHVKAIDVVTEAILPSEGET